MVGLTFYAPFCKKKTVCKRSFSPRGEKMERGKRDISLPRSGNQLFNSSTFFSREREKWGRRRPRLRILIFLPQAKTVKRQRRGKQ